jgi:hypothetical protein
LEVESFDDWMEKPEQVEWQPAPEISWNGDPVPNQSALLGRSNVSRSGWSGLAVAAGSGKEGAGGGSCEGGDFDEFHVFGID